MQQLDVIGTVVLALGLLLVLECVGEVLRRRRRAKGKSDGDA